MASKAELKAEIEDLKTENLALEREILSLKKRSSILNDMITMWKAEAEKLKEELDLIQTPQTPVTQVVDFFSIVTSFLNSKKPNNG